MAKKIGFIDYYLDNWHANNYPEMIRKASGGRYEAAYAWGYMDAPGGMTNEEWAKKMGVELLASEEEVIERSDVLIVLSPDNPEMHERLCEKALKSGKRTYIDKTFADDAETAKRIFAVGEASGTPCFSTSALRCCEEWDDIDLAKIDKLYSEGPGPLDIYSIHQIEPIVRLMNVRVKRLMALDTKEHPSLVIEFEDGRKAQMIQRDDPTWSFSMTLVRKDNTAREISVNSDYFGSFIRMMIEFFETGIVPVPHEQTIDVMAIRHCAMKAAEDPFRWIDM